MKYNFISRTLLLNETLKIVSLYSDIKNWNEVKKVVLEENVLQKNKLISLNKQFSEIKTRLEFLPDNLFNLLVESNTSTIKLVLLFALVKKYRLLHEFIIEVVRDKYLSFNYNLLENDFEKFLRDKSLEYQEIDTWKQNTRIKLKSYIFKILEETGLIEVENKTKTIIKPYLPENLIEMITKHNPSFLAIYLISDIDIKVYKEKYK